jgi:hypothetical protein
MFEEKDANNGRGSEEEGKEQVVVVDIREEGCG